MDYHMYGKNTGDLEITAFEKTESEKLKELGGFGGLDEEKATMLNDAVAIDAGRSIIKISGDQKNTWHTLRKTYRPEADILEVNFHIKATRGSGYASDIALDNMEIRPGPCIEVETVTSDQFTLKWGQMAELIAYTINITPEVPGFANGNSTLPGITVDNVDPESTYDIELITHLTGDRIYQTSLTLTTMPKVEGLAIGFIRSSEVKLRWEHDSRFAGYDIQISPRVDEFDNGIQLGNKTEWALDGFEPSSQYSIFVSGIGQDFQYKSAPSQIDFETAPAAPIMNVKATTQSMIIDWTPVGDYSWLEISPTPRGGYPQLFDNKKDTHIIITGLEDSQAYRVKVFGVLSLGGQVPDGYQETVEAIRHPKAVTSDADLTVIETAPNPPVLIISDQREDSLRVSWPDFRDSQEVIFRLKLRPGNDQLYSTAATEISANSIVVKNLKPGVKYELEVIASYENNRETDPAKIDFSVQCNRNYYKIPDQGMLGPYVLETSWTICGWYGPVNQGPFLKMVTNDGRPVLAMANMGEVIALQIIPKFTATAPRSPTENLSFICVSRNLDERVMTVYKNGNKVMEQPLQSPGDRLGVIAQFKGPLNLIDFNVWNYPLTENEIILQHGDTCVTGHSDPHKPSPPDSLSRVPPVPKSRVATKTGTTAKIQILFSQMVNQMSVTIDPPVKTFKNGVQEVSKEINFEMLEASSRYTVTINGILAGLSSESSVTIFETGPRPPQINVPAIRSTNAFVQWSSVQNAVRYVLLVPGSDEPVVLNSTITQYRMSNLEPSTEYSVSVKAVFNPENLLSFETDVAMTGFTTAPKIENFRPTEVRSTEFTLEWDISGEPSFYKVSVSPTLPGLTGTIQEISSPFSLEDAEPDTVYTVKIIAVFDGFESNPEDITLRTAPLIEGAAVRVLRSTLMMIGWNMIPGATDLRLTVDPPVDGITNGLQGNYRNMVQMLNLRPLTRYHIEISMLLDGSETDVAIIDQETAPSSSGLTISEIRSTSVSLSWNQVENIQEYRIMISPPVEGFAGIAAAQTHDLTIENLVPDTAYAIYVSGLLISGIQTDTSAGRFTSLPILQPISVEKIRSTSATLTWPESEVCTSWDIKIDDENVQVINIANNRVELLNIYPEESYTVTLFGVLDEVSRTDEISMSFTAAPMGPEVDIRNVQSTAFNVLWSTVNGAKGSVKSEIYAISNFFSRRSRSFCLILNFVTVT